MDIMLERILSLIPKKPDGKFVHGALKEFANTVGLKSGNLVSDWINERSTSYKSYVYEIAAKYNVSVEWLKGESEQKENLATFRSKEEDEVTKELRDIWDSADQSEREAILAAARLFKKRRS